MHRMNLYKPTSRIDWYAVIGMVMCAASAFITGFALVTIIKIVVYR